MAVEKDFCTLLTEQTIDEKKASKVYERLKDLLNEEKDLLLPPRPTPELEESRNFLLSLINRDIEEIANQEAKHHEKLEGLRYLCLPTKK